MPIDAKQELACTISHALGVLFGLVFLPVLIQKTLNGNGSIYVLPVILYSFCFVFLFLSSTLYHASRMVHWKKQLQKLDHIAIYFMIAGSYTPFIFGCLEGVYAWLFFAIMWSIVLLGAVFKLIFIGRFERLSLILYLGMGWMVVLIIKPFLERFSTNVVGLIIAGGVAYTAGVFFYANDHKKYFHFVWHLFVLAGAIFHYFAVLHIN